jgi:hypothetical protein
MANIAPHANFGIMNGPIPGEGLTNAPGSAPYQNPPQFVHLNDLLEMMWNKLNDSNNSIQIYGLLKAGVPAEAIARTLLFGAFSHGVCTPSLAMLALKTVVRQIVALGTFLGLKKIKIKNHRPEQVKQLAEIQRVIDKFGSVNEDKDAASTNVSVDNSSSGIFSGIGQ